MSTEDDVRRLATQLRGVTERSSYRMPAYYVSGRIFARIHEEPGVLVSWCRDYVEREWLLACDPQTYFTTDHYRGHASVLVRLAELEEAELAEILTRAWSARAPASWTRESSL